jgi:hypothetical protein
MKHLIRLSAAILVAGLLLSVGYPKYCGSISGKELLKKKILTVDISRLNSSKLKLLRETSRNETNSISIRLNPSMNPIAFNVAGKFVRPRYNSMRRAVDYKATLSLADEMLWEELFLISSERQSEEKIEKKGVELGKMGLVGFHYNPTTFTVAQDAEYILSIEPTRHPSELLITDMNLELRGNVIQTKRPVVVFGGVLAVLGLIGVFVPSAIANKGSSKDA